MNYKYTSNLKEAFLTQRFSLFPFYVYPCCLCRLYFMCIHAVYVDCILCVSMLFMSTAFYVYPCCLCRLYFMCIHAVYGYINTQPENQDISFTRNQKIRISHSHAIRQSGYLIHTQSENQDISFTRNQKIRIHHSHAIRK